MRRGPTFGIRAGLLLAVALTSVVPLVAGEPEKPPRQYETDLLVVGGTESGCAAAIQACRAGVRRVVLVNDIKWLGGQFSAEALGAIDENRAHGYDGTVPIPRSGLFKEVIDRIEAENAKRYRGATRPGNTRVITTARPVVAERAFRDLLLPYEASGRIVRFSGWVVDSVTVENDRVAAVTFRSADGSDSLIVRARLTIDASDFGDVIQKSGAKWRAGPDIRADFDEPSAPDDAPPTDLNPITWCMILEEDANAEPIARPANYDPEYFTGQWGWIDEEFAYTTRRLVDGAALKPDPLPDVLLINNPNIDYPVDVYPGPVADALEASEAGASRKNLVALSPSQRQIVFDDAKQHSLRYLHFLQQRFPKFRRMRLSDEFGTPDRLPPKPYLRESLRLDALHVVREQEVLGSGSRSHYATAMFPDAVFCWQFELDFHPTRRHFRTEAGTDGPWEAAFRGNRRFGRGGTGRAVFPLRALVPKRIRGLLGAQKNLGVTSIVGSSCRLHDQSMHAGQAAGAVAAVALERHVEPASLAFDRSAHAAIWTHLIEPDEGTPLAVWPFADLPPGHHAFASGQQLALRRLLPLGAADTSLKPDAPATSEWVNEVAGHIRASGYDAGEVPTTPSTRGEFLIELWRRVQSQPVRSPERIARDDADGDGIADDSDPLPFTPGVRSWPVDPSTDGLPDAALLDRAGAIAINFTAPDAPAADGFRSDVGQRFTAERGFGWRRDLSRQTRLRSGDAGPLRAGFVFTRTADTWECALPNGTYRVDLCVGDASFPQPGQYAIAEEVPLLTNVSTAVGAYREVSATVPVTDGRLTLTFGRAAGGSNTCPNWVIITPADE